MKLAFRHVQSAYATELFRGLRTALIGHELLSWPSGNPAPTNDIRILLALGPLGRTQLEALPQLELVQTVSAGFESVDVDAASELGIWVSNAPAGLTGNAASVAEFAVMLMIGASRHLGAALRSETDEEATAFTTNQALMGKTTCIVGLAASVSI